MSLNIGVMRSQIGTWTSEETIEVAHLVLSELGESDFVEVVTGLIGGDETLIDELITTLENNRA